MAVHVGIIERFLCKTSQKFSNCATHFKVLVLNSSLRHIKVRVFQLSLTMMDLFLLLYCLLQFPLCHVF